jgi:hypothetical protein
MCRVGRTVFEPFFGGHKKIYNLSFLTCIMKYIKSTCEILALKILNKDVDEVWIDWANQMLVSGYETEHLTILAGISKPFNQFYLQELTSKVFHELSIDFSAPERIIKDYALYLIEEARGGVRTYFDVLGILKKICIERDYEKYLFNFYLLFFALDDLKYSEFQAYWPDADRNNIDSIISDYFNKWQIEYQESSN